MASDFFYPQLGGVEVHIYELCRELVLRGHHVVVVTHQYGDRVGVRWLQPGIKVYYIPFFSFSFNTIIPTMFLTLPLAREILLREEIEILHSHQASSVLGYEFSLHAKSLGLRTVHTEHSLFGFSDMTSINLNKVAQMNHFDTDKIICVSRSTHENLRLRMQSSLERFVVVPNALDGSKFGSRRTRRYDGRPRLITVGRLFYRKGVDLMVEIIPELFRRVPELQWTIIGDGPKKYLLEHLVRKYELRDRLVLLGRIDHQQVQAYLNEADIFVNHSLTESFGIAIIEAACTGLLCVSTDVGAVWQILPPEVQVLAKPNSASLIESILTAISMLEDTDPTTERPSTINEMYTWPKLVARTQQIYQEVLQQPKQHPTARLRSILSQNRQSFNMFALVVLICLAAIFVLDWLRPRASLSKPLKFIVRHEAESTAGQ